jgi:hypothetical protein
MSLFKQVFNEVYGRRLNGDPFTKKPPQAPQWMNTHTGLRFLELYREQFGSSWSKNQAMKHKLFAYATRHAPDVRSNLKSSDREIPKTDGMGRLLPTARDEARNVAMTWLRSEYGKASTDCKVPPLPGHKPTTTIEEGSKECAVIPYEKNIRCDALSLLKAHAC